MCARNSGMGSVKSARNSTKPVCAEDMLCFFDTFHGETLNHVVGVGFVMRRGLMTRNRCWLTGVARDNGHKGVAVV